MWVAAAKVGFRVEGLGFRVSGYLGVWGLRVWAGSAKPRTHDFHSQRLQYRLMKEYSLNHIGDPTIFQSIFFDFKGYWSLWIC